jgi:hypothetical protein
MPKEKPDCGCGFGHNRKSAFGSGANAFFDKKITVPQVSACLQKSIYYTDNAAPLVRFGSARKTRFGAMSISSKK